VAENHHSWPSTTEQPQSGGWISWPKPHQRPGSRICHSARGQDILSPDGPSHVPSLPSPPASP